MLREAQTFRPEIISRFDQVYVFKPLEGIVNAEIVALKIAKAAKEYGVEIAYIDPTLVLHMMDKADAAQDTRELTRIVDIALGDLLIKARTAGAKEVRIELDDNGKPVLGE